MGKRQALRECASSEGLDSETGAAWRMDPSLDSLGSYILPRLGEP
jgi:hypothetical protein